MHALEEKPANMIGERQMVRNLYREILTVLLMGLDLRCKFLEGRIGKLRSQAGDEKKTGGHVLTSRPPAFEHILSCATLAPPSPKQPDARMSFVTSPAEQRIGLSPQVLVLSPWPALSHGQTCTTSVLACLRSKPPRGSRCFGTCGTPVWAAPLRS